MLLSQRNVFIVLSLIAFTAQPTLTNYHIDEFDGDCPNIRPFKADHNAFSDSWFQYAVYPKYLQEPCVMRDFTNSPLDWSLYAHTDHKTYLIEAFCFDLSRSTPKHRRTMTIYTLNLHPKHETISTIQSLLKQHYKFPLNLLHFVNNSKCAKLHKRHAIIRV